MGWFLAFLDPKIQISGGMITGVIVCITGGVAVIVGTITKIITRNHISKGEAFESFQTNKMCDERSGKIEDKLSAMEKNVMHRFDILDKDIKEILRNGKS